MGKKIELLLVEDTPSDVRLTEEALKRSSLDYNLKVVNDGEQAMEYLKSAKQSKSLPDIVLLDLNMPKKNGHEVLEDVSEDNELKKVPFVVLTVSQRDEDVMEALRLKMNYYLAKPITSQKLSSLLKAIYELENQDSVSSNGDYEVHMRMVLAGNPHTSPMVLEKLAGDSNERVRCRVSENANVPSQSLLELAKDTSREVRLSVLENPKAPKAIFELLCQDESEDVRLGLSGNHCVPKEILEQLSSDENVFVADRANKTLAELAKH